MTKQGEYSSLVENRKNCKLCSNNLNFINPANVLPNNQYDSNEIGPWTLWQNSLNAKILIVGQDWGSENDFKVQMGKDKDGDTNSNLGKLCASIGIDLDPPTKNIKNQKLFFTNQVLCLRNNSNVSLDKKENWEVCKKCGENYLKPLIEIIKPEVIIALGKFAFKNIAELYGSDLKNMSNKGNNIIIDSYMKNLGNIYRIKDGPAVIPVCHCSPKQITRNIDDQIKDWRIIKNILS
jgi:uracil-DNA glycosylase family 4